MSDATESPPPDSGSGAQELCLPCRGAGQVVSQLGGTASLRPCPWCGGSGIRQRGVDAQSAWMTDSSPAPQDDASVASGPDGSPPDQAA